MGGATLCESHPQKTAMGYALNTKFAGRTNIDGIHMSDVPRPTRLANSVDMTCYRMHSIVNDFGINYVPRQGSKEARRESYMLGR